MAYKYRMQRKADRIGKKDPKYYAIGLNDKVVDLNDLAGEIAQKNTLTRGDILATVVSLCEAMDRHLAEGEAVRIDGLGIFSISATSDGFENPEECTPSKVRAHRLCYLPDVERKKLLPHIKFERKAKK